VPPPPHTHTTPHQAPITATCLSCMARRWAKSSPRVLGDLVILSNWEVLLGAGRGQWAVGSATFAQGRK
jgi:hypothetical protein